MSTSSPAAGTPADIERERFFDLSVDMLVITSSGEGCWKRVNPACSRTLGWSEAQLLAMPVLELVHPEDIAQSQHATAELAAGAPSARFEQRLRCKDGGYKWIAWNVTREPGSALTYCVGRDITERKCAEEALRVARDTFEHLVQNSPFGIYVVDADFRLAQVSAGAQKVFENVRPLLGRDFADVLRCIWPEPFASEAIGHFRRTLATGEPYHAPSTVERRQDIGQIESYDWKIERVTLPDGRPGAVCHFYDLSERQRYEVALRETDRRKDEFLATLAHELRNPLAPIQSGIDLLRLSPGTSPDHSLMLDMMQRQMVHLGRLVDELLDVSRITRGKITLDRAPYDATEAIRDALEDTGPALRDRRVSTELPAEPLLVDADPVRLVQIVTNLLNNAAKYTGKYGRVWICAARDGEQARISVRDDGIGIAPEALDQIFDLFLQADGGNEGLGIGLTLVRSLVELHGGRIEVHSAGPDRGSEFIVHLPLLSGDRKEPDAQAHHESATVPGRRVLVVDDNRDAAESLSLLLQALGASVRTANDGASALEILEDFRPQVVFLDLGMPDMDGFEVAAIIRSREHLRASRLVAVTGWGQEDDRERTHRAGFDVHLVKPVVITDIESILGSVSD